MLTMRDALLGAGRRYRDRVAVRFGDTERSFSDQVDRACRLANALAGLGLVAGDRVAVLVEDQLESMEPYFACAIGGFVSVTVNRRLANPEMLVILNDSGVRALVHTDGLSEAVEGLGLIPDVKVLTIGDGARPSGALSYEEVLANAAATPPGDNLAPADPFTISYTSGTTGVPKGAVMLHGRQLTATLQGCVNLGIRPYNVLCFSGSFSFAGAMTGHVYSSVITGGSTRIFAKLDPEEWFRRMAQDRSTLTYVPSPLMPQFIELGRKYPSVIENLTTVLHGAAPPRREVFAELIDLCGPKVVEVWGMTESGGAAITATTPSDRSPHCLADDPIMTVGRSTPFARVRAVDEEGVELPLGSDRLGELVAECSTLFAEYWNRPADTAQVLQGDRYRTGDIGIIDEHGYCYLTGGRLSEMINSGGMNVYPVEVEQVLLDHPGVAEAAVFGRPDERWGEAVTAAIRLRSEASLTATDVLGFIEGRLAGYKRPSQIHFVDDMPRTASMKIKKHELRSQLCPPNPE
ncbi:AMP-binding protein [Actinomadura madurae]|uniref:class I adenylate-forming enzyme family protein n=1 Tax=Actinomadura madurae TaxID=1993 RepID=UPI00399C452D